MTAALAEAPANGTVTLNADGAFTYVPRSGFAGTDSFTYRAATPAGGTSAATTVSIAGAAASAALSPSNFRITAMRGHEVSLAWTLPTVGPVATGVLLEGG